MKTARRRREKGLLRLAQAVSDLPFNRPGQDKTYVLEAMHHYNSFLSDIRSNRGR